MFEQLILKDALIPNDCDRLHEDRIQNVSKKSFFSYKIMSFSTLALLSQQNFLFMNKEP